MYISAKHLVVNNHPIMSRTQYQGKPSAVKRQAPSNDRNDNHYSIDDTSLVMTKQMRLRSGGNQNEESLAEEMLLAIRAKNSELSKELISAGADVNGINGNRTSLLTIAVIVGNCPVC